MGVRRRSIEQSPASSPRKMRTVAACTLSSGQGCDTAASKRGCLLLAFDCRPLTQCISLLNTLSPLFTDQQWCLRGRVLEIVGSSLARPSPPNHRGPPKRVYLRCTASHPGVGMLTHMLSSTRTLEYLESRAVYTLVSSIECWSVSCYTSGRHCTSLQVCLIGDSYWKATRR